MRALLPLLAGCAVATDGPVPDGPGPGERHAVAVMTTASTTYEVGALAAVPLDAPEEVRDVATLHGDAVVRVDGGAVWAINRLLVDSVRRYAPGRWSAPVWERSTGRGSNPQDVAVCGGRLVVARYEEASLLVLDVDDGAEVGTIDLSAFADDDGIPEAADLARLGDRLFVGLQRLRRADGWDEEPEGRIVELDCEALAATRAWATGPDPVLAEAAGAIAVVTSAGVARFDGEAVGPVELVDVDGARVVQVAYGDGDRGAFVARDEAGTHTVGCLDDALVPTVLDTVRNFVSDVAVDDRGEAWLAVRQGWDDPGDLGGARVIALDGCTERVDGWARPTFAPYDIAFY